MIRACDPPCTVWGDLLVISIDSTSVSPGSTEYTSVAVDASQIELNCMIIPIPYTYIRGALV